MHSGHRVTPKEHTFLCLPVICGTSLQRILILKKPIDTPTNGLQHPLYHVSKFHAVGQI